MFGHVFNVAIYSRLAWRSSALAVIEGAGFYASKVKRVC